MPIWPSHRSGRIRRLPWQPPTLNKAIRRCRGRFMKRPYINATSLPAHHRAAKRPRAKPPRQKLASHKIGRGPGTSGMERPNGRTIPIATLMNWPLAPTSIRARPPGPARHWPFQGEVPGARVPRGRALGPWVGGRVPTHPGNGNQARAWKNGPRPPCSRTVEAVKTAPDPRPTNARRSRAKSTAGAV